MKNPSRFARSLVIAFVLLAFLGFVATVILADGGKSSLTRIQVTPRVDKIVVNGTPISFSTADLGALLESVFLQKTPIPLVFEHLGGPHGGRAAGWLRGCSLEENGTWCDVVWTPFGRQEACTGAWRFISPNVRIKADESGLLHPYAFIEVSLTNVPALDGMAPVATPECPIPFFSNRFATYPGVRALAPAH